MPIQIDCAVLPMENRTRIEPNLYTHPAGTEAPRNFELNRTEVRCLIRVVHVTEAGERTFTSFLEFCSPMVTLSYERDLGHGRPVKRTNARCLPSF